MCGGNEVEDIDDSKKFGEPKKFDPNFNGPLKNRSCTDVLCCLIFFVFVLGMVACSVLGYMHGDPMRLVYPTDSDGNICGQGNFSDKPNLMFFDLLQCAKMGPSVIALGCPTPQVCVKNCTSTYYVYLETIAKETANSNNMIVAEREKMLCKNGVDPTANPSVQALVDNNECAAYYVENTEVVGRCVPAIFDKITDLASALTDNGTVLQNKDGTNITGSALDSASYYLALFYQYKEYGELVYKDIVSSWILILIGLGMAVFVCLVWIVVMRWIAGIMVWISIFAFFGLFGFSTYYSYSKYYELKTQNSTAEFGLSQAFALNFSYYLSLKQTWLAFGCTSATILIIFLLIIIFLAKRICIAIELIKEGSKAIGYMMFTLLWPITPFLIQIIIVIYWGSSAMFIASMGEPEYAVNETQTREGIDVILQKIPCEASPNDTGGKVCHFVKYGGNEYTVALQAFMLFMFFWLMNFVVALGEMVLAGAFASYYWAFEKPGDIPPYPLASSLWRALRYHTGSLAFGALLVAIVQMIRVVLEYIDQKLKKADNTCATYCMKCMKCCFWCLEKILRFINKNAYIMIAIYGRNFCAAAKDGFFLIMRNIVRTVVLDKVTDFILFISKLMITGAIGVAAFFWYQGKIPLLKDSVPSLNYYLTPVIILVIGSYLITCSFFNVYNMAVDTLFLCFLEDIERNDGSPDKPYYMSKGLQKILRKTNKRTEEEK